ncbi:DNA translocase FtsK [Patescibacteria group bacterium]|nr:DNA translocase FtsK [Patescibacteria group bacterium]
MTRKKNGKNNREYHLLHSLPDHTKKAIIVVVLVILGIFLTLAAFGGAGVAGGDAYRFLASLLGVGYFLLPLLFFLLAGGALREEWIGFTPLKLIASGIFIVAGLGFISSASGRGGLLGTSIAGPLERYFDLYATLIALGGLSLISLLIILEGGLPMDTLRAVKQAFQKLLPRKLAGEPTLSGFALGDEQKEEEGPGEEDVGDEMPEPTMGTPTHAALRSTASVGLKTLLGTYTPPPLSLLERDRGRPGVGDIKANANIIKRTLANFGIVVELDEISIGPSVTRYAIKPAEGVRLQKIVSLQTNLELALAAHPVRIEAPIPGKSLVGIEVPNSSKVTVGLGTLLETPEFAESQKPLVVALGRDIAGGSHFGNLAKMPHALIAGATGSGKSVTIHAFITSLLYRCGPQQLRFIMIDPKRVELTTYNRIPHLLTPVITDAKRTIAALRWAGKEMERRYNILEEARVRDIASYHENILAPSLARLKKRGGPEEGEGAPETMPYIVIIIDELADIMHAYPRELEAAVVRLAQMSRAVGIHLILSTQRPSVNVITGLIKANIPARIALQVASQIDSRTILDGGGAEKLLGAGDMLYLSGDMGKPIRLQSAFIGEAEVKKVTEYIAQHNEPELPVAMDAQQVYPTGSEGLGVGSEDDGDIDDDLYEASRLAVIEVGKASTSYLQRKLRVGYSRAARIMDLLEERGVIGAQDGSKPREVLEKTGKTAAEEMSDRAEL